jgi:uncharacterized protein
MSIPSLWKKALGAVAHQNVKWALVLLAFGSASHEPIAQPAKASGNTAGLTVCQTSEREADLFAAIKQQNADRVKALLATGVSPNARSGIKFTTENDLEVACVTALMYASWVGDVQTAAVLLKAGADANARDNWGRLVWAYAIGYEVVRRLEPDHVLDEMDRRLQLTELLLASGAKLDLEVRGVWSPAFHAVEAAELTGDFRIFKKLIAAGVKVNSKDRSILADAIGLSHSDLARARAQVSGKDVETEIIETLLASGANVNAGSGVSSALTEEANGSRLKGAAKRVKLLLMAGAEVNALDSKGETPLFAAINPDTSTRGLDWDRTPSDAFRDQMEVLKLLLAAGANPNQKNRAGDAPLHAAYSAYHTYRGQRAWKSDVVFKALIDRGADVNVIDAKGNTALTLILSEDWNGDMVEQEDRLRLVRILIAGGANVNLANTEKHTPLSLAIINANDEVVEALIAAKANVNERSKEGATALFLTAAGGTRLNVARLLTQTGADVNISDQSGQTPLMAAINSTGRGSGNYRYEENKVSEIVGLLIEAKANVNVRDKTGDTALMMAVRLGREEKIVQALLAAAADANLTNHSGDSALIIAARRFGSISSTRHYGDGQGSRQIIEVLVASGADVKTISQVGESALTILATKAGEVDLRVIRTLIAAGLRDGNRGYPRAADLYAAIRRAGGHSSGVIVQELIAAGADVNAVDERGNPALIVAVRDAGNAVVVRGLLTAGARVNAKDENGDTALIAAVQEYLPAGDEIIKSALHRDLDVIRALLAAGADVRVRGKDGQSALALAERSGNADLIELLKPSRRVKAEVHRAHQVSRVDADQVECLTSGRQKDLFEAIKQKDSEKVKALLAAGVNPNARSEINFEVWESTRKSCATALMQATLQGDLKTTEVLLAAKADVNASDSVGRYIWAYAFGYQNIKRIPADRREEEMNVRLQIVNALLAAEANPDSQDPAEFADYWSETALFHAATAGLLTADLRILKMVIAAGASVKDPAILPYVTRTVQREAWRGGPKAPGAAAVIKTLLAAGVNVNGQNNGASSLMMEAYGWKLEGTVERAKVLLAAGADVNAQDGRTGETALLIALKGGMSLKEPTTTDQEAARSLVELIGLFLASGADPNKRDKEGDSPLPASFDSNLAKYPNENEMVFKALVKAGADLNSRNKDGRTILALAAWRGACDSCEPRLQLVRTLLASGADVNAQDAQKKTPLLLAVEGGYGSNPNLFSTLVSTLIAAGADVNLPDKDGETPLMGATGYTIARSNYGGTPSVVQLLLKAGAKVNAKNINGDTALTVAVLVGGEESISQSLIAAGADVNVKNNAGDTALLVNVKAGGNAKTIQGLIAAGADVNVKDRSGDTALIIAARLYGSRGDPRSFYDNQAAVLPIISALIDSGDQVKTLGADGESALTIMVTYSGRDSLPIIHQLIAAGQGDGSRGYPRVTDLMASIRRAAGHSSSDVVRELIAAKVDVNGVDESGTPALIVTVRESGNVAVVHALLDGGAHVNARDTSGDTALIAAIREYLPSGDAFIKNALHRDPEVVRALLTAGADPRGRGKDGDTALELAKKCGNPNVIGLLQGVAKRH